ncbi:MAG: hypothetical protein Q9217_006244 [Psora testacea]
MSTPPRLENDLKPVLQEIVRTQVCFPKIKLVVTNVMIVSVGAGTWTSKNEAFRLFLTDGEKTIQAVVRRRMHRAVLELSVRQGSALVLTDYHIAKGKRLSGEGHVAYLAISDFYIAGYNEQYGLGSVEQRDRTTNETEQLEPQSMPELSGPESDADGKLKNKNLPEAAGADVKHMDLGSETIAIPRCNEWIRQATAEHHQRCHINADITQAQKCPSVDDAQFWDFVDAHPLGDNEQKCTSTSHIALRAMVVGSPLQPIKKPLSIVDLASVTGVNKSRNQTVDVLAAIDSIDDFTIKPARLPLKRDIHIIDPSASQPVTLSIFVDPVNFHSKVGTVALFRNVTTHDYRRGNLNAYPVHCEGREWFIPNPRCIDLGKIYLDDWEQRCEEGRRQRIMSSDFEG